MGKNGFISPREHLTCPELPVLQSLSLLLFHNNNNTTTSLHLQSAIFPKLLPFLHAKMFGDNHVRPEEQLPLFSLCRESEAKRKKVTFPE